ncbi:hypothetical protein NUACC21_17740 [Scytonema sp. NUACC21]
MQTISVKCKIEVPVKLRQEIDATLLRFADACNQILEVASGDRVYYKLNKEKLKVIVYYAGKHISPAPKP